MKVETFKLFYGNSMGCRLHRRTIYGGKNKIVFHKGIMAHPYLWKDHREVNEDLSFGALENVMRIYLLNKLEIDFH